MAFLTAVASDVIVQLRHMDIVLYDGITVNTIMTLAAVAMAENERKLKTTIYLRESVLWLLREAAVRRRIASDSSAMEEAIRYWHEHVERQTEENLNVEKNVALSRRDLDNLKVSEPVHKLIRMLIAIFSSGKDEAIRAVRQTIEIFYKYTGGDLEDIGPTKNVSSTADAEAGTRTARQHSGAHRTFKNDS